MYVLNIANNLITYFYLLSDKTHINKRFLLAVKCFVKVLLFKT